MGDSPLDSSEPEKPDRPSYLRVVVWGMIALALIVGIVLFFRYSRQMTVQL
jgi:type VI protein secretion system component VasF